MAYKIIVSVRAQKEIENAIDYYSSHSVDAPQTFITILEKSYNILATSHFSESDTKTSGQWKLKNFPILFILLSRKQTKLLEYFLAFIIN